MLETCLLWFKFLLFIIIINLLFILHALLKFYLMVFYIIQIYIKHSPSNKQDP